MPAPTPDASGPRRYFSTRAHALFVLRSIAPTKLADGAWLYGLLQHWRNPRLSDLVRTYVEELGEGLPDKNHVLLYRNLLARHALAPLDDPVVTGVVPVSSVVPAPPGQAAQTSARVRLGAAMQRVIAAV